MKPLSYAQNMEDMLLSRLFLDGEPGFYIDVGGGHVVADNVSFRFYERGWRGIVVEPNARLAAAYRTVRPRDVIVEALCGRSEGTADFFEADAFHGLSTTVAAHAATAADRGVATRARRMPMTTLAALCARHAPARIDFLKVDVEGAEADVLAGNDWSRHRPRVVVLEAVAPWSMADASSAFEPALLAAGYRFAFFDNLNRFYVSDEAGDLSARFPDAPLDWATARHLGEFGPAHEDASHPDHDLARRLDPKLFGRFNALSAAELRQLLPPDLDPEHEALRAALARIACLFDGGFVV